MMSHEKTFFLFDFIFTLCCTWGGFFLRMHPTPSTLHERVVGRFFDRRIKIEKQPILQSMAAPPRAPPDPLVKVNEINNESGSAGRRGVAAADGLENTLRQAASKAR